MAGDRKVSSWRGWPPRALLMDNNRDISPHPGGSLPRQPNDYFRSYIATLNATMNTLALCAVTRCAPLWRRRSAELR